MSKMLEQAIADAAALREQAIKNAEQSVLDQYSKQIKEAVDQMLEVDDAPQRAEAMVNEAEEELMQEEEAAMAGAAPAAEPSLDAPAAWDSRATDSDIYVRLSAMVDNLADDNGMVELDLGDLSIGAEEEAAADGDLGAADDLGALGSDEGAEDDLLNTDDDETETMDDELDLQLQEVLDMLTEEEVIEEKVDVDYDPIQDTLNGMAGSGAGSRSRKEFNAAMADVVYGDEDEEESEEINEDDTTGVVTELHETVKFLTQQNDQMESVLTKMEVYLEETLLSNAKLLYQNRTLGDASLNERQKSKIVEAIANADSPKEAKQLFETLRATVGSTPNSKRDPQSLSESVNRKSNLSAMLNSRQNINESKNSESPFMEKMQKLAGIKK
jgi:hypothetical protein